jgi:WD40 repeat protein
MNIQNSVAAILSDDGKVVGTGFLASDLLVITCAHVVVAAEKLSGETVQVRFEGQTQILDALVVPEFWLDVDKGDIAVLRLTAAPTGASPLPISTASGSAGHDFYAYGYATVTDVQGIGARGKIVDIVEGGSLVQLNSQEPDHGMSGGPVLDEARRVVIGMVTKGKNKPGKDGSLRNISTTFATAVEVICNACPALRLTETCPYRKLDAFSEQDAPFFFGRGRLVEKLVDGLRRNPRFLAVLGPSGSGKSSVVRAGLIPALRGGQIVGSQDWGIITTRPAKQPFEQLAAAGLKIQDGLENAVRSWKSENPETQRLVLVIDQFEEILISTPDDIRHNFIEELANLLNAPIEITVILTLRDDFYSRFVKDATALAAWLERGLVNAPLFLEKDELKAIVEEPAKSIGLHFDDGLVEVIVDDACEADQTRGRARSTILPLLEFALTQLWELRVDGRLTHDAYQKIGGTTGGLSQWADRIYYELSPAERVSAEAIFCSLVHLGDEKQQIPDVRKMIPMEELEGFEQNQTTRTVTSKLVGARLLSVHSDYESGREYVEIIHDALLREWAMLEEWIDKYRHREQLARERRRRWTIFGLSIGLVLMFALAVFAWVQRNNAVYQAKVALAKQLVAQAESTNALRSDRQMFATLLATYSMELIPSSEASQVLLGSTQARTLAATLLPDFVNSVEFSRDGKLVVSTGGNTVVVLDTTSGKEIARREFSDPVYTAAFSPNGQFIVSSSKNKKVCVWEVASQKDVHCFTKDDNGYQIVFSPNEKYFAAAGEQFIHVWETDTLKLVNKLRTNSGPVFNFVFSQDGSLVVAGDKSFGRVWDVVSGEEIFRLKINGQVNAVAIDSKNQYVVTGGEDSKVRVWDIVAKKEILHVSHAGAVNSVRISPDGKYFASGSSDNTLRLWDLTNGSELSRMSHDVSVFQIAFSPDGGQLVSASSDKTARVWEAATGREIARMAHDELVSAVAFSPDGKYVASGSYDHTVRVWPTATNAVLLRMDSAGKVYSAMFSPDGQLAATGASDGTARVWNISNGKEIYRVDHDWYVFSLAFSKDGKDLVSGGGDTVIVSDVQTGKEIFRGKHSDNIYSVSFSPDGRYVASGGADFTACVWEVASGVTQPQACIQHEGKVHAVAFSPDGRYVVSGSDDRTARVWDAMNGQEILRLEHENEVFSVAFSPDGKFVLTGDSKTAQVWDAATGAKISQVEHNLFVYSATFSPDGKYVVSGGGKIVKIWESATGKEVASLTHGGNINWVAFSPDGKYITSGDDLSGRVWNATTGEEIARMAHGNLVKTVAFSPDGKYIISGGFDRTARIWSWQPDDLVANSCAALPRNLTEDEWQQYLGDVEYEKICPDIQLLIKPTPTLAESQ